MIEKLGLIYYYGRRSLFPNPSPLKDSERKQPKPPMENYDVIGPHLNQDRGLQRGLHNWEDVLHVGRKGGDGKRNGESLREREINEREY